MTHQELSDQVKTVYRTVVNDYRLIPDKATKASFILDFIVDERIQRREWPYPAIIAEQFHISMRATYKHLDYLDIAFRVGAPKGFPEQISWVANMLWCGMTVEEVVRILKRWIYGLD